MQLLVELQVWKVRKEKTDLLLDLQETQLAKVMKPRYYSEYYSPLRQQFLRQSRLLPSRPLLLRLSLPSTPFPSS